MNSIRVLIIQIIICIKLVQYCFLLIIMIVSFFKDSKKYMGELGWIELRKKEQKQSLIEKIKGKFKKKNKIEEINE